MKWRAKERFAHRLAWEEANGPIPVGLCVCHRCDVPACINVDHLFLGTQAGNMADMVAKGRSRFGARHHSAILSDADALAIRGDIRAQRVIAKQYGISQQTVSEIKTRRVWKHLLDAEGVRAA